MQGWPCWPEEGQTVKHSLYAIGTKEFSYGLCKIWPLSPGFGHYKENSWAFTSLWLHLLGTKTSFLLFALVLPRTTELHPLHARGGAIDARTLLLCTPVPSPSLPSCILVLTSWLASDQPHVKKKPKHLYLKLSSQRCGISPWMLHRPGRAISILVPMCLPLRRINACY